MAAGRIRVQIDADKAVLVDAAVDLGEAVPRRRARALRQHRHADKILREQRTDPADQLVAGGGPGFARRCVAKMVAHARRARGEDRQVGAALALHLELAALDRLTDLIIGHRRARRRRLARRVRLDLLLTPSLVLTRRGGVVAVAVDDHGPAPPLDSASSPGSFRFTAGKHHARQAVNRVGGRRSYTEARGLAPASCAALGIAEATRRPGLPPRRAIV